MQIPEGVIHQQKCKKCNVIYYDEEIEIAFRELSEKMRRGLRIFRPTCKLCEQEKRDLVKNKTVHNMWKRKVYNTTRSHGKRLGIPMDKLVHSHGWDQDHMAREAAHSYENGCPECHKSFKKMNNGLGGMNNMTLDIRERDNPPDKSNTLWICITCNLAKGTMSMLQWTTYKRLWRERPNKLIDLQTIEDIVQLSLFDDQEEDYLN